MKFDYQIFLLKDGKVIESKGFSGPRSLDMYRRAKAAAQKKYDMFLLAEQLKPSGFIKIFTNKDGLRMECIIRVKDDQKKEPLFINPPSANENSTLGASA
jgi:hypothetical protein